ncbi:host attachment protein [Hyphobacterium sp.]|jgi:protein required for attachment to host cells|uniref:baeRF12 domain-containing protein n=1 Tax=Hyphobacterium sp. TaxID=2004662 RepID=UPI003BAB8631
MTRGPRKTLWVAVMDGSKGLVFRNDGDAVYPVLKSVDIRDQDVPPDREIQSDKPGRVFDRMGHRSAVDQGDAHEFAEKRFVERLIADLNAAALDGEFDQLLIYADSESLGEIREHYHDALKSRLLEEFPLDVVNEPVDKLEKRVKIALRPD